MTRRLSDLLPGSLVIGEEACAADPSVLDRLGSDLVWVIDPIDGTMNFVRGKRDFAVMVSLIKGAMTAAAWIYRPTEGQLLAAETGAGAYLDGRRLTAIASERAVSALKMAIHPRYFPKDLRSGIERAMPLFAVARSSYCAAVEYQAIVSGTSDGALYWRLHPWDHAAGVLIVKESGGRAGHLDGSDYAPTVRREGLLVLRDPSLWDLVRAVFP